MALWRRMLFPTTGVVHGWSIGFDPQRVGIIEGGQRGTILRTRVAANVAAQGISEDDSAWPSESQGLGWGPGAALVQVRYCLGPSDVPPASPGVWPAVESESSPPSPGPPDATLVDGVIWDLAVVGAPGTDPSWPDGVVTFTGHCQSADSHGERAFSPTETAGVWCWASITAEVPGGGAPEGGVTSWVGQGSMYVQALTNGILLGGV